MRVSGKLAFLALSILVIAAIVFYSNPYALYEKMSGADPTYLVIALLVSNAAMLFRVLKWNVLVPRISFFQLTPVQFFGMSFSNLTPGKMAEPVKSLILKVWKGIPVSETLPSVMWERIMDLAVLLAFGAGALYFLPLSDYFFLSMLASLAFLFLIIGLFAVLCSQKIGRKVFGFARKFPILKKIDENFIANFYNQGRPSAVDLLKCLAATACSWIGDAVVFYLVFLSISPSPIQLETMFVFTGILSISILLGILSSLPGGLGGTEAVMVVMLTFVGFDTTIAASAALLCRVLTFGYASLLGFFSFIYLGRKVDIRNLAKF